ncbi:MAG: hypothetical protein M5R40_02905 [Anaerolineae bacterium]|nr:hypothetical protein [Anaerolineae bacterium]
MMHRCRTLLAIAALAGLIAAPVGAAAQEPEAPPALTETFTTASGFTFRYPEGWTAVEQSDDHVQLTNNPDLLDAATASALAPGDVMVAVAWDTADALAPGIEARAPNPTPAQVLRAYIADAPDNVELGEVAALAFGAVAGARAEGTFEGNDVRVFMFDAGEGHFGNVIAVTASGELAALDATITAIAASAAGLADGAEVAVLPTPTPLPPGEALPLTETHTFGSNFRFRLPAGWPFQMTGPDGGEFASDADALSIDTEDAFAPGQLRGAIIGGPADLLVGPNADFGDDATPAELLAALIPEPNAEEMGLGAVEDLTIAGRPAARRVGAPGENAFWIAIVSLGDGNYIGVAAFTAADALAQFEPTLLAIAESAVAPGDAPLAASPETETYASESGVSLTYPAGWVTFERGLGNFFMASSEAAAQRTLYEPFAPGETQIFMQWGPSDMMVPPAAGLDTGPTPLAMLEIIVANMSGIPEMRLGSLRRSRLTGATRRASRVRSQTTA